ncbi:MAG: TIM barrel protein, partial [Clostridia bacterium]|nr:TIM barrel protein [Clostridia bacterium]
REKQIDMVADLLSEFGKIAEQSGICVVFEPLNVLVDHAGYLISKSSEAFDLIKRVNSPAVKVLFDIYHQQITEGNVIRNITENIDIIGHFHIGDNPGRKEPGTGELNYTNIFSAIKNTGYNGYLAFECSTSSDAREVARKMSEFVKPFED